MSAAATAAGYLYASGRLRGRGARDPEHAADEARSRQGAPQPERERSSVRKTVRVAALPPQEPAAERPAAERPKRAPRIEYRTRRWRPGQQTGE